VDTSKEFAGYTFKENKNPTVTAFISDPQDITLVYTKKTGTGSNGSGSNGSGSNGSGNSNPNNSVPNNTNSSSGNNGSVNNPSSSNSQGSNSQGSNTGNSNNNSSSASNGQNNGSNLPNNEPNNIPSPVNRKPKTVKPHKTINKGFNIKDQNTIHNQQLANSLKNNGSSPNAQNNASNTLPQTGNDKHNSLAMLALGSLALATALGAAWFGRKKD
ncbi:MAG: LPXTG cell wall anchor domain-containing protein, partial [Bombilactobacillus sp.]